MTSASTDTRAGMPMPDMQLDTDLTALFELADQIGHHVEACAGRRLIDYMDAQAIDHLDTRDRTTPIGYERDTAMITLVSILPAHLFTWTPADRGGSWRVDRAAIADYIAHRPAPMISVELVTVLRPKHRPEIHAFAEGVPIAARQHLVNTNAPFSGHQWRDRIDATMATASRAARAALADAYAKSPGKPYIDQWKEPDTP